MGGERLAERCGVVDDAAGIGGEGGQRGLLGCHGDGGRGSVVRSTLQAGEDGAIDGGRERGATEDHAAAGAAEGLVRRRGDDVCVGDGRRVQAGRDEARDVGDVAGKVGANLVSDLAEEGPVDEAWVGSGASEDELGLHLVGDAPHLVVVDALGHLVDRVLVRLVEFAGEVDAPAMREVAAVRQAKPHDGSAGLDEAEVDGHVGGRTRVGLHVGMFGAEEGLEAVDGELLDLIDVLLTLVVALARVAFAVLVGERCGGGLLHGARGVVLAGDEADDGALALLLAVYEGCDFRVLLTERIIHRNLPRGGVEG